MEDVIQKLAEIETAASRIMNDVTEQKKKLAEENERKIREFDAEIDKNTTDSLQKIRQNLEVHMKEELEKQKTGTDAVVKEMEDYYHDNHQVLATKLYNTILRK